MIIKLPCNDFKIWKFVEGNCKRYVFVCFLIVIVVNIQIFLFIRLCNLCLLRKILEKILGAATVTNKRHALHTQKNNNNKRKLCRLSSWAESRNYRMQLTIKLSLLTQSPDFVPKCHDLSHLTHVKYHRKLCKNSTTKLYWSTCIRSIMSTCITFLVNNFQSPIWKIVHILWSL